MPTIYMKRSRNVLAIPSLAISQDAEWKLNHAHGSWIVQSLIISYLEEDSHVTGLTDSGLTLKQIKKLNVV